MKAVTLHPKTFLAGAILLAIGWFLGAVFSGGDGNERGEGTSSASAWTCSMHPQIQQPKPGKCPICAMDLIPLSATGDSDDRPRVLAITETSKKLAKIATVPVTRKLVQAEISLVGKVAFDETRTRTMAARFPARIDRLYVDYTGIQVRKGDHLARVYSPELLTAQQELLSAIRLGSRVELVRDKLRLWDLSEERIRAIEKRGKPSDQMDIDAVIGGIVITKHVNQGDYVKTGQPLFTISDFGTVWVKLSAYESDAPWLRYGQPVTFQAEAVPGQEFEGTVAFISPVLNPKTRTIDLRVNAKNPQQLLKPGMFVRATVRPTIAAGGKVVAPDLRGKWISPMHPEVIADKPGPCPVCGMALVKPEELGYAVAEMHGKPPLVVPASAVLRTGKRSVVYVEVPDTDQPTYEGREIVIGPRAGDYYLVEEGLEEGERVVTQGNFKIDSALQILARPSMMNPDHGVHDAAASAVGHVHHQKLPVFNEVAPAFREALSGIYESYISTQQALAADSLEETKRHGAAVLAALDRVDLSLLENEARLAWMNFLASLRGSCTMISGAGDMEAAREAFYPLSNTLIDVARSFQVVPGEGAVEAHCPMAFKNHGANWIQLGDEIRNPYFGARMLKCGRVERRWDPEPGREKPDKGN